MGTVLEEVKGARDAGLARNLIVQIGTQHRRRAISNAVRDLDRSVALGEVTKYEICVELSWAPLARASRSEAGSASKIQIGKTWLMNQADIGL